MAPFPSRGPLLPTSASYPPSPSRSPPSPPSPSTKRPPAFAARSMDPISLFGDVGQPGPGVLGGLGRSWESKKVLRDCLRENHINNHTFTNDEGFHNHLSHHLLAAYSLGAGPKLLADIYELESAGMKPMLPLQPFEISDANWTDYLGDERFYPNYLVFFNASVSARPLASSQYAGRSSSAVPAIEKYLLGGEGDMLIRAVSGAIHPLIHIGHGVEFGLDALVAEGLAQCAVHSPRVHALFDSSWPPATPRPTSFQSTLTTAFSSFKLGASSALGLPPIASNESFVKTAAALPREWRAPREGLSGFTILERILHDPELAPGVANAIDDFPRLDKALENRGARIKRWCEEWRFSGDVGSEWDDEARKGGQKGRVPRWEEIVEKCEELIWMATVILAASTRPGYVEVKMDFFLMHGVTSVLFLPTLLEAVSPHLRPYLLHSHFRVLIGYWISRGRPDLFVKDLMAATAYPSPPTLPSFAPGAIARALKERAAKASSPDPNAAEEAGSPVTPSVDDDGKVRPAVSEVVILDATGEEVHGEEQVTPEVVEPPSQVSPWPALMASASDHTDDHLAKVIRTLAFAATHFGDSPPGIYVSSLPGTDIMDGSIFARAAGLVFRAVGWAREGDQTGAWDRSVLGFDSVWDDLPRLSSNETKGKGRVRETRDEEIVNALAEDSAVVESRPSSRATSPKILERFGGFVGVRREVDEEDLERELEEEREEEDRELMG